MGKTFTRNVVHDSFQTGQMRGVFFRAGTPSVTQSRVLKSHTLDYGNDMLVAGNVQNKTFVVLFWLTFQFFFFQCICLTVIAVDVGLRASLTPAPLTDHHEAGLIVKRRPVGVNQRLLQLLQVYEAAVV